MLSSLYYGKCNCSGISTLNLLQIDGSDGHGVFPYVCQAQCQEVRKRKELELQILTEAIRCWEGEDIKTLGNVIYMSQVMIQCAGSEVMSFSYLLSFFLFCV